MAAEQHAKDMDRELGEEISFYFYSTTIISKDSLIGLSAINR